MRSVKQGLPPIEEIVTSVYWESMSAFLLDRLNLFIQRLKKCSPENLGGLQGKIEELEYLLGLPEQLQVQSKRKET